MVNPEGVQSGSGTGSGSSEAALDRRVVRTAGNSVALSVEKLKGRENYVTWAFAMKMTLIREGTWGAVEPRQDEVVDEDTKLRALSTICLSVEKINYSLVMTATDAKQAWDKLKKAFQDDGIYRRISLLQQLTSIRLENFQTTEAYVDAMVSTSHKLAEMKFAVSDEWLASLLLMGLPKYYAPMVMGMEASGQALSADAVKSKILQDVKPKQGPRSSSDEGAFYSGEQHQRRRRGGGSSKGKDDCCFNCSKPGHYAANCPEKPGSSKRNKGRAMCAVFAIGDVQQEEWYFDSGATTHMARVGTSFEDKRELAFRIGTANNGSMCSKAKGTVNLECVEGDVAVQDVLEVPDLAANLLSVGKICEKDFKVLFTKEGCQVLTKDGEVFASGVAERGLYRLNRREVNRAYTATDMTMWHRRMGHLSQQGLKKLQQLADGIQFKNSDDLECVACIQGKHSRDSFPCSNSRAEEKLELVHTDLCGPFEVPSIGGSRYFMSFIDDATRRVVIYTLETKDQALEAYEEFKAMAERQTGKKLKILRSDNGREYVNSRFKASMARDGVRHQKTCPYTPEQNGIAERMNRTILDRVRSMLNDANLPKRFWAEAVNTAVYLINRSPTRALGGEITPEEAWTGKRPYLGHLKIFGATAMVHQPKQKRRKLDAKSIKCVFMGYAEDTKGFRVYEPERDKIIISRDVIIVNEERSDFGAQADPVEFLEIEFPEWTEQAPARVPERNPAEPEVMTEEPTSGGANTLADVSSSADEFVSADDDDDDVDENALPPQSVDPANPEHEFRRSGRERRCPGKYSDYVSYSTHTRQNVSQQNNPIHEMSDPTSYSEVLKRPDRDLWIEAMRQEIEAHETNGTWELQELPKERKAIRNKWVFTTKRGVDGQIERYKARLVVKGCSQRPGIDFEDVYAPVVRYSTIRYLMAMAAKHDLEIDQMDAVTAFLQGTLGEEEIYMEQPKEFSVDPTKVCRLKKAMYGLKQSSRVWNHQLDAALREFGLERSKVDACLYFKIEGDEMLFLTVYVDDFLLFSNNQKLKMALKKFLCGRFHMKDLGEAKYCLGLRIRRDRVKGELYLDQENYIEAMLEKFQMANCYAVATPFEPGLRLDKSMCPKTKQEEDEMKNVPYKEAIGSLMYLSQVSRPDISYAVNAASQYSSNPGRKHWEAVKRIFRYLRGTAGNRLCYRKNGNPEIAGYTDADWGGDIDTRKSTTGYVFLLQGGAISWNVKRQPTVALSSCEAEYMAMSRTIQEALWWQGMLEQIFGKRKMDILCDNQSAICVAKNGSYNPRTKHVDIRYHFVHDSLENGVIELKYVNTKQQAADGFTKPLAHPNLKAMKLQIGIED